MERKAWRGGGRGKAGAGWLALAAGLVLAGVGGVEGVAGVAAGGEGAMGGGTEWRVLPRREYLVFEAEEAAGQGGFAPLQVKEDRAARGGRLALREGTEGPAGGEFRLHFRAEETGTVFIWVRAKMPRASREYLTLRMDGNPPKVWWDHTVFPRLAPDRWIWHHADSYEVEAGEHTLTVAKPMPGMGLDAVAVSLNPAYCPKLAREGCIYLTPAGEGRGAGGKGEFTFDLMGDHPVEIWARLRPCGGAARAYWDDQELVGSGEARAEGAGGAWERLGRVEGKGGAHRIEVRGAEVEELALSSRKYFAPEEDPFHTGKVRVTPVAIKPDREFKLHRGYTLADVPGFEAPAQPVKRNAYGGRVDRQGRRTGFFHMEKLDGRWTFIDPEGCVWLNISMNHFGADARLRPAMLARYGQETAWADQVGKELRDWGFTSVGYHEGGNTPTPKLGMKERIPYFVNLSFMMGFARSLGYPAGAGNQGYPGNCIMPFHPDFAGFCAARAKEWAAAWAEDPWLIGYYLDNELAIPEDALVKLLELPATDAGHQAALSWLAREGIARNPDGQYPEEVLAGFFEHMLSVYLETAIGALRQVDANHLVCGIRANAPSDAHEAFLRTLGRYADVISLNHYMRWTVDPEQMSLWLEWAGKPVIISEWYAKGMDTKFANVNNAGWVVPTQADRGAFYQNFTLTLLQHPAIVGWNWFRLYDDLGNDVNKGVYDQEFRPYEDLVEAMAEINRNAYELREHLQARPVDTSHAAKTYSGSGSGER